MSPVAATAATDGPGPGEPVGPAGPVRFGIDRWQQIEPIFAGRRVGLLTHEQAVDSELTPTYRRLADAAATGRLHLVSLFGPEHGFYGAVQDALSVGHDRDRHTGLPLYSLFGPQDSPTPDMLADLDVLVCDLVDAGVRFYTYAATMARCMEACAREGKQMVILDRPNPLGGQVCGGPQLDPDYRSFLGYLPTPLRHGLTLGELGRFYNDFAHLHAQLHVVPVEGWGERGAWPTWEHPWVPPSPNLPTFTSAVLYPGMCLVEGTNLSEGRGTTLPFEMFGAPWVDEYRLADALNEAELPGVHFRPAHFIPTFWKYQNEPCGGVQVHLLPVSSVPSARPSSLTAATTPASPASPASSTWPALPASPAWPASAAGPTSRASPVSPTTPDPLLIGLTVLVTTRRLYPDHFRWRVDAASGRFFLDLLLGSPKTRQDIESGREAHDIVDEWTQIGERFKEQVRPWLLYGRNNRGLFNE